MKNRNVVSQRTNASDSIEVYPANTTPENHDIHISQKITIPTIRLTQATPSDTSAPSIIAPKSLSPRKKIVPKKSKLALLSAKTVPPRERDLSDVLRRVNASATNLDGNATCNVTVNGGTTMKMKDLLKFKDHSSRSTIDIYVDPANDPDIGEIVVIKKKKSRAKLDGLFDDKNDEVKEEPKEESKWWSIRGRKKERLRNDSLNALKINVTEASTVFPEARQRCGSTPLSPPDSGHADSMALRAMKSIARIGSWAQLKNSLPRDLHQAPSDSRVKTSISSFEVGALSTHTAEDLTNRLSPMRFPNRVPFGSHKFLNPSITNTSVRSRTASCGTVLSVTSTGYLQPNDNRCLSISSSSGESNRPGSTYTASGEDTGAWGIPAKLSSNKSKKGIGVSWGSVSSALVLSKGKKKSETLLEKGKAKVKASISKNDKRLSTTHPTQDVKENIPPTKKANEQRNLQSSHRHTVEGRRRTHVRSIFPGLSFGRSADLNAASIKTSMPPIAEDPSRSRDDGLLHQVVETLGGEPAAGILKGTVPAKDANIDELSDSDSDLSNRYSVTDEEPCIRLSVKYPRCETQQFNLRRNLETVGETDLVKARPRPRSASEHLLDSNRVAQCSRPVGIVVDSDIKHGDGQDVLSLSVLEAANSDLASLINRLDLEATPDKDRDITTATIAAWKASSSAAPPSVFKSSTQAKTCQGPVKMSPVNYPLCSPSDIRCSVFRGNGQSLETEDIKLMYRDPIAFLDPTMDSAIDLSNSAIGESFAFINNNNGISSDDSPLRYIGKVRAMTRAMGTAAEAAGGTMSKRLSAISAGTRASVTSLRPYALSAFKNNDENMKDVFTRELQASSTATISPAVEEQERAPSRQSMELRKQSGDFGCLLVHNAGVSSASSTQNLELSSKRFVSERTSCTSSVVSTFGTRSVLAKMRGTELGELMPGNTIFESGQTGDCKTFGTEQTSLTYVLPSLDSADGSPVSLYASQFGIEDTPTRPVSVRGDIRRSSGLVPISQRPIPRGSNVRCKVDFIERLTRFEHDQEEQERKKTARKGVVKRVAESNHLSTFSRRSHSSTSSYSPSSDEGISVSTSSLRTRRSVERSAHSSLNFGGDEHLDSDVPGELKDVPPANIQFPNDSFSSSYHAPSLSSALSTSVPCNLPPSPGLPPTGPLPIPESSKSLIIPTPPSTNSLKVTIESSPPAPSLLPVIDPSPSPKTSKTSLSLPVLRIVPPHREQSLSEGGDIDGSMPRVASQSALSTFGSGSDDDTKQSFDFTGELKRLNESGGSNRLSFVEQLDAAFKTPPHVTVRGGVGIKTTAAKGMTPILIPLEAGLDLEMEEGLSMMVESLNESMNNLGFETSRSSEALISPQTSGEVISKPSYGRLDTAFKFGGRPGAAPSRNLSSNDSLSSKVSDVISLGASPSQLELELPRRRPSISIPTSPVEEDSSVLRSIYIHARANEPTQLVDITLPEFSDDRRVSSRASDIESDTSSKRRIRETTKAKLPTHERQSSDISFLGFSSFGAIRTKFEFGPDRPDFYSSMQASQTSMPKSHFRHESLFSIASVSSYGEVIKPGMADPFNYGPFEDEEAQDQLPGLDSFGDRRGSKRFSTDSDMSSFYFKPGDGCSHHTRNQSVLSTNSANGPPISLYNRTFNQGHRRNDSGGSMSSIAAAYSVQGANGGRAAWMRHQQEQSVDSVISDFSRMRLGRPGVGDKMFESIGDHYPLTSITASPPESVSGDLAQKSSYDSILDEERRSTVDSIFDNTGHRSSISSDSVFWHDPNENEQPHDNMVHQNLLPSTSLFRPLSFTSAANHGTSREDDTMITMLGGEHVRRRSLGSSFEASPCFRVEKQKRGVYDDRMKIHYTDDVAVDDEGLMVDSTSPTAKIGGHSVPLIHAQSAASVRSMKFGETRMNLARNGLLHRESLEGNCLSADGEEDVSMVSTRSKGFSRPAPRRQRKPVLTITQPPDTTPPLSSSDGSGESQSSIDVERLKVLLHTAADGARSSASRVYSGARIRAPGQGHRRRASQVSKGSVFGTIQEETSNESPRLTLTRYTDNGRRKRDSSESSSTYSSEPLRTPLGLEKAITGKQDGVFEPQIIEHQGWDEERWVVGLRRYYALRSEADEEIKHSRTTWPDTHFSLHALNTFVPPRDPAVMQALLEHSVKNYMPLPIDRHPRRIRSRAQSISRLSPFSRSISSSGGSARSKKSHARSRSRSSIDTCTSSTHSHALRPKCVNNNMPSPHPMLVNVKPYSPFLVDLGQSKNTYSEEESFVAFAALGEEPTAPLNVTKLDVRRPRVLSATRRSALGWSKRNTTKDDGNNKENETHGLLVSPSESLRIVRPRPRSRVVAGHVNVASRPIGMLS